MGGLQGAAGRIVKELGVIEIYDGHTGRGY
jgi:hypothetical protein